MIKLNETIRSDTMRIFAHGIYESSLHIRKILSNPGRNLFTHIGGIEITLKMARRRRKHCMKMFNQARRGFIL